MSKVSILCAVFNAEPFLPECLKSLRNQTLRDIQIICIDDASTDGSLRILQEEAKEDPRIVVLHNEVNEGQAAARNRGISVADGAFITMVDADDWLAPDALEQAWNVAEEHPQTDAVLFDLVKVWPDREEHYPTLPREVISGTEGLCLSLDWQIHGLYIVRADIQRRWPYDDSARLYSDDNTTRLHYLSCREIRACKGIYYYRQHADSCTGRVSALYFESLRAQQHMHQLLGELHVASDIVNEYEKYRWLQLIDNCYFLYLHQHQFSKEERAEARRKIVSARKSINTSALPSSLTRKFGYRPCSSFGLFMLQEWMYFTLRKLTGKL